MENLPDNVHIKGGRYYYVTQVSGKREWIPLTRVDEGEAEFYIALGRVKRYGRETLSDIFDQYLTSGICSLAPGTQKSYRGYIRRTLRPVFGEMLPDDVEPVDVAQYLELRKEQGAAVAANREKACLSSVYNFAMRKRLASRNPCKNVTRNRERPKNRYVRDDEYLEAFEGAEPYVQDLMAVIYLMGLRPNEARELKRSQITPKGIRWEESKTGRVKIVEWTSALQYFITRATSRCDSRYVLTNSLGGPWTQWGMSSAMRRIRRRVDGPTFTWHDLRAKAESDSEEGMGLLPLYKRVTRIKPVV